MKTEIHNLWEEIGNNKVRCLVCGYECEENGNIMDKHTTKMKKVRS